MRRRDSSTTPGTVGFQPASHPDSSAARDGGAPSTNPGTVGFQPATAPWHSRGYLPHCDEPERLQHITFRLFDSLPRTIIEKWKAELEPQQKGADDHAVQEKLRRKIETYLDGGHGSAFLNNPAVASLVQASLLFGHTTRYTLHAWCIMPNNVHVLFRVHADASRKEKIPLLASIVHGWKSYTAVQANRILGRKGKFWMREYYDRFIRDERHYRACVDYIHENPVKAGLVNAPEEWPWPSATPGTAGFQSASAPDRNAARDGGGPGLLA